MTYKHNIYEITEFQNINEVSGIYSWHLRFSPNLSIEQYYEIMRQKVLRSGVKGSFDEFYSGKVYLEDRLNKIKGFKKNLVESNILAEITETMAIPVYIGMSKNLNSRLSQHLEQLRQVLFSVDLVKESDIFLDKYLQDTDDESSYFAKRIGKELKEREIKNMDCLFVKVYELEKLSRDKILTLERILNYTCMPIYGKR